MGRQGLIVCGVVGLLGLLAAATAFAAEATRTKASEVQLIGPMQCSYPRSPAMGLGLTAALAIMVAEIVTNVATGCICCGRNQSPPSSNRVLAVICFILSWFTAVLAFLLLLAAATLNDEHDDQTMYFGYYYCYVVKPGVFAGGAMLCLATVTLGILSYLLSSSGKTSSSQACGNTPLPSQGGIAMGQPQFPPGTTQDPVFVHEDTYIRRQFT